MSGLSFEHHDTGGGSHRLMAITPDDKVAGMLEYYHRPTGAVEHEEPRARVPEHADALVNELKRRHPQATPKGTPPPEPEKPRVDEGPFYHGTTVNRVRSIMPANKHKRGVTFPHDTDRDHAYATSSHEDAWQYAQKAWNATGSGRPRVYQVEPMGHVERDPQFHPDGGHRGNYDGDHRSRDGWRVVRQMPMPRHMGRPSDWDS